MAYPELLEYVRINQLGEVVPVLSLYSEDFIVKQGSFKVIPPVRNAIISEDQRRWGGGLQVGETNENGALEFELGVAGETPQQCLTKVEELLAMLETNP